MTTRRLLTALAAPVLVAAIASACSSGTSHSMISSTTTASIPADAAFNAADVSFAQSMIPHHAQAVEMADMAIAESSNPQVLKLARAIRSAQQPEIDTMTTWLTTWGQAVPDTSMGSMHAGHDMSGMDDMDSMEGMMSAEDMQRLDDSTGTTFDRLWIEMMIQHHRGAVRMAQDELASGKSPEAKALAEAIIAAQTAEIADMQQLLASLPA